MRTPAVSAGNPYFIVVAGCTGPAKPASRSWRQLQTKLDPSLVRELLLCTFRALRCFLRSQAQSLVNNLKELPMRPGLKAQARAWQDRLHALKNLPPVLALLWNSGRTLVAVEVGLRLTSALISVTALWVSKLIIDAIVAAAAGHPVPTSRIWTLLAAEFLLAAAGTIIGRAIDYCDGRIADRF